MFCNGCGKESEKRWCQECRAKRIGAFHDMKYCEKCGERIEWPVSQYGDRLQYRSPKCLKCNPPDLKKERFKIFSRSITGNYKEMVEVVYECSCDVDGKVLHHFDYRFPFHAVKLCQSCHTKWHRKLRRQAAQAASNTHLSDVPVSNDGASLTRTSQQGNGDNAPDTVLSDAQVEPIREAAQTASEQPSLLAEMR